MHGRVWRGCGLVWWRGRCGGAASRRGRSLGVSGWLGIGVGLERGGGFFHVVAADRKKV